MNTIERSMNKVELIQWDEFELMDGSLNLPDTEHLITYLRGTESFRMDIATLLLTPTLGGGWNVELKECEV